MKENLIASFEYVIERIRAGGTCNHPTRNCRTSNPELTRQKIKELSAIISDLNKRSLMSGNS